MYRYSITTFLERIIRTRVVTCMSFCRSAKLSSRNEGRQAHPSLVLMRGLGAWNISEACSQGQAFTTFGIESFDDRHGFS